MAKTIQTISSTGREAQGRRSAAGAGSGEGAQGFDGTKFDQSVEIAIRLGIDNTQAEQIVRGSIVLPHGIGKQQRVVVFAKGAKAEEARAAGADTSAKKNWPRRSKAAGPSSTPASPRRT